MRKITLGIDVGGTNIKLGLVNALGKITARSHLQTKNFIQNKEQLILAMVHAVKEILGKNRLTKKDIFGIGIGLPGLIDSQKGIVDFLPNIPGWKNVPLAKIFYKKLGIATFIENDVNLITLGEWKYGVGRGYQNIICMTLGTGVGGGLILDNRLYRGETFVAGEIGHMPINEKGPDCNCGGYGCLERYVGNQYLLKKASKIFNNSKITLEEIYTLANQGDRRAVKFWEEAAVHIGNALVGAVNLLNPRLVVIGGGVSNNFKFLYNTILKTIQKRALTSSAKALKIMRAKLGDDAGIIGAHVLVKDAKIGV